MDFIYETMSEDSCLIRRMVAGKHHSLNPKDACNASGLYIYERIGNDSLQGSSPLNGGNREISPFALFTNTSYEVTIYRKTRCKCRKRLYIYLQGFAPQVHFLRTVATGKFHRSPFLQTLLWSVYISTSCLLFPYIMR